MPTTATILWGYAASILVLAVVGIVGIFFSFGKATATTTLEQKLTKAMSRQGKRTHESVEGLERLLERVEQAQILAKHEIEFFRSQLDEARMKFDSKLSDTNRWVQVVQRKLLDDARHGIAKAGFSYGFFTWPYQKRLWLLLVIFLFSGFVNAFSAVSAVNVCVFHSTWC